MNPASKSIDNYKDDYEQVKSIDEILDDVDITKSEYENPLMISDQNDFQIHLRRMPDSCFLNNYFADGLIAWEVNLDIQSVFNHYKAVAYLCTYLSKSEDECPYAMKQAAEDSFEKKLDNYSQMKLTAHSYTNRRECSVQERVYHVSSGQWLRKTFPGVVFANSNVPEKRFRACLREYEISDLPQDSKEIFKHNMMDHYIDSPNADYKNGKYGVLDSMCFTKFLRYYSLAKRNPNLDNDY